MVRHTVHLQPSGYSFLVEENETVLAAALRQGFIFPHHCKNALCGQCKGRLLSGEVTYLKELRALTQEEREQGYALFCSAYPRSDLIIFMPGVMGPDFIAAKKVNCDIASVELVAPGIHRVFLSPEEKIKYHAGQYLEILHQDRGPRPFSIANAPQESGLIELHVRHQANNPITQSIIDELQTAKKIKIAIPFGTCVFHKASARPTLFLAGGVGFAPIKALIEAALTEQTDKPMWLYWGVRSENDFYFLETIQQWQQQYPRFKFIPVISGKATTNQRSGLVHEALVEDHSDLSQFEIYASGPFEMVYAALRRFLKAGLHRAYMYSDAFEHLPEV